MVAFHKGTKPQFESGREVAKVLNQMLRTAKAEGKAVHVRTFGGDICRVLSYHGDEIYECEWVKTNRVRKFNVFVLAEVVSARIVKGGK